MLASTSTVAATPGEAPNPTAASYTSVFEFVIPARTSSSPMNEESLGDDRSARGVGGRDHRRAGDHLHIVGEQLG
jgi:hypothetical protein